jgi:hypothetical protein
MGEVSEPVFGRGGGKGGATGAAEPCAGAGVAEVPPTKMGADLPFGGGAKGGATAGLAESGGCGD